MADNLTATPGTGVTLASDDISGVQFPRIKVTLGADGVNDGDVSADNPMPVTGEVEVTNTVTVDGAVDADVTGTVTANAGTNLNTSALALESGGNLAACATSLAIIDDWDESDRAKVNPIVGQAGVQGGSGSVSANTQRVVLATDVALPAGTNQLGTVSLQPTTSGGLDISRVISAASTNATVAKASAGQLYGWFLSNTNAAARYLKIYNLASSPTVGTSTVVMTVLIPGNTAGAGTNVAFPNGIAFSTGIAFALTTGVADSDTNAVAANEIVVNLFYK